MLYGFIAIKLQKMSAEILYNQKNQSLGCPGMRELLRKATEETCRAMGVFAFLILLTV